MRLTRGCELPDDAFADRPENQHRQADKSADDDDHADKECDECRSSGVECRPRSRMHPGAGQRAGERERKDDRMRSAVAAKNATMVATRTTSAIVWLKRVKHS